MIKNQAGGAGIILIIIIALVVVAGGVAYFNRSAETDSLLSNNDTGADVDLIDDFSLPVLPEDGSANDPVAAEMTVTQVVELAGFNYGYSVEEIRVKQGDLVKIVLTSTDGFHDWVVDEFAAATQKVNTGGVTEVEFVASEAGTFEYYCSVGQHRALGMVGQLIVEAD